MSLLSPILSTTGWIYGQDSFVDRNEPMLVTPLYYPDANGDRYFNGQPYSKYVKVGAKSGQPYPTLLPFAKVAPSTYVLPRDQMVKIFDCQASYAQWSDADDVRRLTIHNILTRANVPLQATGLAGSKACECTKSDSDIDVLIRGTKYVSSVLSELQQVVAARRAELMGPIKASKYARRYGDYYSMDQDHLGHIFAADVTKLYVEGQKISFIFVYDESEKDHIPKELYDDSEVHPDIEMQARIINVDKSWLYPRCYSVKADDGSEYALWSHQWIHKNLFPVGTKVQLNAQMCSKNTLSLSTKAHRIRTY